jgi:hypothetical protein
MSSPYQVLLNKEANVNVCEVLLTDAAPQPKWPDAFEQCENYRRYLDSLPIDPRLKIKSFLLTPESIEALLKQGGGLDAIRIYIGHEIINGERAVRLFAVGAKKGISGKYDDWNIPHRFGTLNDTILGEVRPCPDECGSTNDLNHP